MFKNHLRMAALAAGLLVPGIAAAAASAVVTTDLNFRTGPSASYPAFDVIPAGDDVTVYGCLAGYGWCDIEWAGYRGWVSGSYLAYLGERYYRRPISSIGISIGLPVVRYDRYDYYDRWYDDDRFDRYIRREIRKERREEAREERREDRREFRRERRENRWDARQEERRENRAAQRRSERQEEARQEARQAERQERRSARQDLREDQEESGVDILRRNAERIQAR